MLVTLFRLVEVVRIGTDFLCHQPRLAKFAVIVGALAPCRLALRHSAADPVGSANPGITIDHRYKLVHAAAFPGGARVAGR
jgi:hypothetical protein